MNHESEGEWCLLEETKEKGRRAGGGGGMEDREIKAGSDFSLCSV